MGEDRKKEFDREENLKETAIEEAAGETEGQEKERVQESQDTREEAAGTEESEPEESGDSYEFMKETIKAKPLDKKKLARQIGKLAGSGAVFGLAAALVFGALAPGLLQRAIERKNDQEVQFQNGTEETEEEQEETQEDQEDTQQEQTTIIQEMTPEDYQTLYSDIFSTAQEAEKSVVTVNSRQNDQDWFQTPYESQISGLLVAESGQEYYKADSNTGFAIVKVEKSQVPAETQQAVAIAPLGESYNVKQGEPVLAIGSPMGYSDSVGYGIVTSTSNAVSRVEPNTG